MSRDGRKVWEGLIESRPAIIRMTDSLRFTLEVDALTFEGDNPKELRHTAELTLSGETDVDWKPIILIEPMLDEGRLCYRRMFEGKVPKSDIEVHRAWRIDGKDEKEKSRWNVEVETYRQLDIRTPGARIENGPRLTDRRLPYTPELWALLNRLDEMLRDTKERVARKIRELVENADLQSQLALLNVSGPKALIYDPKRGGA